MTIEPVNFIYECKQVDNVRSVIGQIEKMGSQKEFIREANEFNIHPGLSLDLYTPVDSIEDDSWEELHILQIMGNLAGVQGQPFKGDIVLDKIKEVLHIKKKFDLQKLEILVDIGVNEDTIGQITKAGADGGVVGSVLWKSDDIEAQIQRLQEIATAAISN
jgi:ribulose-phosphate 3-epimerase